MEELVVTGAGGFSERKDDPRGPFRVFPLGARAWEWLEGWNDAGSDCDFGVGSNKGRCCCVVATSEPVEGDILWVRKNNHDPSTVLQ
jgi:hypothetical protein